MYRHFSAMFLALLAAGLVFAVFATPATAGDDDALREEVRQLREKIDALSAQKSTLLEQEIESYLDENSAWKGAQGGALAGVTISASFTAVTQASVGLDPFNRTVVNGDVDLDFDFQVTDNLDLFIYLTANEDSESNPSSFPGLFGPDSHGVPPEAFPSIGGSTFSGLTDGIGVNGTTPKDPGSITVREAGIHHSVPVGDNKLHWEMGTIDPRLRFLQNAFADNENTQFINNLFDDSPSVLWLTDSTGRTVFGWHMWISFGDNKQYTLNWGWFNTPGQWFNNGQGYVQFHWKGEVSGREMNIRVMGFIDEFFVDSSGDGSVGGGASWDWWVSDNIGVFVRFATNGDDVNSVELDVSGGVQLNGLLDSRPNDVIGIAVGVITANTTVLSGIPEDTELTIEIYYKYVLEDGKLQITPHVMIITDPGGGLGEEFDDDILFILGIRIHVPF